jgi:hypothetical protein
VVLSPPHYSAFYKGHSKKKVTDLGVVGWFLGGQKSTRVGQIFFRDFFSRFYYSVFKLPSPRNAQKRDKKKSRKNRFWIFLSTFLKNFSTQIFGKTFSVVSFNSRH